MTERFVVLVRAYTTEAAAVKGAKDEVGYDGDENALFYVAEARVKPPAFYTSLRPVTKKPAKKKRHRPIWCRRRIHDDACKAA